MTCHVPGTLGEIELMVRREKQREVVLICVGRAEGWELQTLQLLPLMTHLWLPLCRLSLSAWAQYGLGSSTNGQNPFLLSGAWAKVSRGVPVAHIWANPTHAWLLDVSQLWLDVRRMCHHRTALDLCVQQFVQAVQICHRKKPKCFLFHIFITRWTLISVQILWKGRVTSVSLASQSFCSRSFTDRGACGVVPKSRDSTERCRTFLHEVCVVSWVNLTGCTALCRLKLISPSYHQKPGRNQLCLPQMLEDWGALQVATRQQKPVMGKYNFMCILKIFKMLCLCWMPAPYAT